MGRSYMWSQGKYCAGASRLGDGSCTMTSPLHVTAHRACLDGCSPRPLDAQHDSFNRDSCNSHTHRKSTRHSHSAVQSKTQPQLVRKIEERENVGVKCVLGVNNITMQYVFASYIQIYFPPWFGAEMCLSWEEFIKFLWTLCKYRIMTDKMHGYSSKDHVCVLYVTSF